MRVSFVGRGGLLSQLPVIAAVEMFDHAHANRFFLVIAHVDLKRFVYPALAGFDVAVRALALADNIEGIPSVES